MVQAVVLTSRTQVGDRLCVEAEAVIIGWIPRARKERLEFGLGSVNGTILPLLGKEAIANLFREQAAYNLARLDGRLHDNALSPLHQSIVHEEHNGGKDKDKDNDDGDHNRNVGVVEVVHFHGGVHRQLEDASVLVDLVVDAGVGFDRGRNIEACGRDVATHSRFVQIAFARVLDAASFHAVCERAIASVVDDNGHGLTVGREDPFKV